MNKAFNWVNKYLKKGNKIKKKWILFFCIGIITITYFSTREKYFQNTPYATVLLSKSGQLLSANIAQDGQWRFPSTDSLPDNYTTCLKLFEDEYFNYHFGVNPVSTLRALWQNFKAQKTVSGGSTITMQVIRLSRPKKARNIWQKLIEMVKAIKLELHFSKAKILSMHAAHAPFGGNVVGLEAASWRYYNRSSHNLSWAEYALLAVLPNAPSLLRPGKNEELLMAKRNRLLDKLFANEYIDETELELSKLEPIPVKPLPLPQDAYHLLQTVSNTKKGQQIQTHINANLQKRCQNILDRYCTENANNNINNGAIIVADIETGQVLSYVGNASLNSLYGKDLWNDMATTKRSTGSILKPFLYASMLNEGQVLPHSLVDDVPTFLSGYAPKNYNQDYNGAVPASMALARSLNVPAVRMLKDYSYPKFHSKLTQLGMKTLSKAPAHYGLSIILGGAEGTLLNLCAMYASMGRSLLHFQNHSLEYKSNNYRQLSLFKNDGNRNFKLERTSVLSASSIWFTFKAMEEVHRPDNQKGWEQFSSSKKIAWKTGTSFGYRDAWAIGVDGKYVVGVWIGNASGEGREGLVGVKKAAPVMFEIFNILPKANWFTQPFDDCRAVSVCAKSGFIATDFCEKTDSQSVPDIESMSLSCPYHKIVHLNKEENYQVNANCYPINEIKNLEWFVLPPVQEYYYAKKNVWYKKLPPILPNCGTNAESETPFSFIYPENFSKVKIPIELDGSLGKIVLKLAHRQTDRRIFWYIDKSFVAETNRFHELGINLKPGEHEITVVDSDGASLNQKLTVLE